jgi:class 3 adenylate cyclase/tetratricopeptide (TPR) repeat protein
MSTQMLCRNCNSENPDAVRHCGGCGVALGVACRRCGHRSLADDGFCSQCGARLRPSKSHGAYSGERKQATVLFADVVGSTALIAELDAEDAIDRLKPAMDAMIRSILQFDGTIVRTLGDGLKAVFGAPHTLEEHALLACRAAFAMQKAVASLTPALTIRIGLHSGEIVAGAFDIGLMVEQDAKGLTAHIANRIEQIAEPGAICVSRECHQLVAPYCESTSLGAHLAKGLPHPIEIYRLTELKSTAIRNRLHESALTPFRGRIDELSILKSALADAKREIGGVIGICAPLGAGKSRLCFEFADWCRQEFTYVLEARAVIYGHAMPLQPVLETLRSFFRVSSFHGAAAARRRIKHKLLALDSSLLDSFPLVCEFLGIGDADQPPPNLDPKARYVRLRDFVGRLLKAAGRKPAVFIIEDLHWLDEASSEFVETLVDSVVGTRMVLVVNFRPSFAADWMNGPQYRELRLPELGVSDIRDLVADLVGPAPELFEISAEVCERSGGNPFFAEALVQSLVQSGVLVGGRMRYSLGPSPQQKDLPPTVEAAIGARIDQLGEDEKVLLQIGATIGKEFPVAILQEVSKIPTGEMEKLLARLSEATLIKEQATTAGPGFAFHHPLIQEVTYAMQLRKRRTALHAAVARAIEGVEWGKRDEFAGLLAHHFEAAGQPLEAVNHLQRAGRWIGKTNSAAALKNWKKVRSLLNDQPRSEANDRLRALASGQILSFGYREGMSAEDAKPFAEEALSYARTADKMHEPILLGAYGRILAATAAADDYVALVQDAVKLTSSEGDAGRFATVNGMLSQAFFMAGRLNEAFNAGDVALAAITMQQGFDQHVTLGLNVVQLLGFDVEHWIRCLRTRILVRLGRFSDAEEWLARVLQIDPDRIVPIVQFIPHLAFVEMAWARSDSVTAQWHAAQVGEIAEKSAIPYVRVAAMTCSGLARSVSGDFSGAARSLRDAIEFARRAKAGLEFEAGILTNLADAHYRGGDFSAALETSQEAIAAARRRTDRVSECHASIVRAMALAGTNDVRSYDEAIALRARAEQLMSVTGAALLEPELIMLRSHLEDGR